LNRGVGRHACRARAIAGNEWGARASSFDTHVGRDGDRGHLHAVNVTFAADRAIEDSTGLVIDYQLEKKRVS
jgi:hypothetical protein